MFIKKFSGSTSFISGASNTVYAYSDPIALTEKKYDGKELALKIDITSTSSGSLDVIGAISEKSEGTYTTFITNGGTSQILTSGTSGGGGLANGSYFIPLMIAIAGGGTYPLRAVPYFKLGIKASLIDAGFSAYLCVG